MTVCPLHSEKEILDEANYTGKTTSFAFFSLRIYFVSTHSLKRLIFYINKRHSSKNVIYFRNIRALKLRNGSKFEFKDTLL